VSENLADLTVLVGLLLTLVGAVVTAWAVILRPADAIRIGVPRWAGDNDEENLKLPLVQNLLASSRWAKRGLICISGGTVFQMVPILLRLF